MKKYVLILLSLLILMPTLGAQKTRFGQPAPTPPKAKDGVVYPIGLHVTGAHVRPFCDEPSSSISCYNLLYVEVVLNGMKIELLGDLKSNSAHFYLPPGDYKARLTAKSPGAILTSLGQGYELLLSGNYVWSGSISGYSE